jgi:hypothetical protein
LWINGDSYVEPSHCPHSYSLASGGRARIVSYTGQSNIAALVEETNGWSTSAFEEFVRFLDGGLSASDIIDLLLARRGFDRGSAAAAAKIDRAELDAAIDDPHSGVPALRAVGHAVGLDYRLFLPAERRQDEVGKTCMDLDETRRSRRWFGGYEVASMASAPHLPDLSGLFMRIGTGGADQGDSGPVGPAAAESVQSGPVDLVEPAESHYLVTHGDVTLEWLDAGRLRRAVKLNTDGSAWVAPFVRHRWVGDGGVVKFGSGAHVGYLDLLELTNTYAPANTVRRSRRDTAGWGYDR